MDEEGGGGGSLFLAIPFNARIMILRLGYEIMDGSTCYYPSMYLIIMAQVL